jgi:hypothetical protein
MVFLDISLYFSCDFQFVDVNFRETKNNFIVFETELPYPEPILIKCCFYKQEYLKVSLMVILWILVAEPSPQFGSVPCACKLLPTSAATEMQCSVLSLVRGCVAASRGKMLWQSLQGSSALFCYSANVVLHWICGADAWMLSTANITIMSQ